MIRLPEKLNKTQTRIVAIILLALLAFLVCTSLSSYIFYPKAPQLDSSVFRYVGMVMQKGGVPYRDTFDHKGPLIFLFNYIGLFMGKNGIWFIELALMFVTVLLVYKIFRFFCNQFLSVIGTCVVLLSLYDFLGEGNYTEEYALPFITCAIYIYSDYFLKGTTKWYKLVLCGACAMAVLLLRANMVATWIVFSIAVIVREIQYKSKKIVPYVLFFSLGAVIMLLPFLFYFAMNGALKDFWDQYIVFNIAYTSASGNKAAAIRHFLSCGSCAIAILITLVRLLTGEKKDYLDWITLVYIVVSIYMIAMSGRTYSHYGIILAPLTIIPLARLFQYISVKSSKRGIAICSIAVLLVLSYPWVHGFLNRNLLVTPMEQSLEGIISKFIKDNTDDDDVIIQCGHKDVFYVLSDRMAASKYSYPLPIAMINNNIYDEFFEDLRETPPAVIITDTWTEQDQLKYTEMNRRIKEYINEFEYVEGPSIETYSLYYAKGTYLAQQREGGNK